MCRHGVIGNHNQLQPITDFIVIVILESKCHLIAIAIEYIGKVITVFMITTTYYCIWFKAQDGEYAYFWQRLSVYICITEANTYN